MKKLLFSLSFFIVISASAQVLQEVPIEEDTTYWTRNGSFNLQFTQVSLSQWAKGGDASLSGLTNLTYRAQYLRDPHAWETNIELGYGLIRTDGVTTKNEDKIDLMTKYGRKATENLYYTALMNFRSQFAPGYLNIEDSIPTSAFMAPGVLLASLGLDYKPNQNFSLYFSPATAKFTFVLDDRVDETLHGLEAGESVRKEFGAYVSALYDNEVMTNVLLKLKLDLFNNYTDPVAANRGNIDVNFEGNLALKINRYFSAGLFVHLIYDHDTDVPKEDDAGNEYYGKGLQMKQVLGVGIAYIF